jgi:hypothetical protein
MSDDAYTRIALRLREVGPADREWLLSQLDEHDCKRVSAALSEHRRLAGQVAASPTRAPAVGESSSGTAQTPNPSASDPVARLLAASPADVKKLLADQPDWALGLLLAGREWPWAPVFLGSLPPERIRALRALVAELSQGIKPKVHEMLVSILAGKLEAVPRQTPITHAFDAALQKATAAITTLDAWKLDLS